MTDLAVLHARGVEEFGRRVHQISAGQWHDRTPCSEWDVRVLVNHVTVEQLWAPYVMSGKTLAEVGDRFDGDQLGADPLASWDRAAADAAAAFSAEGALLGRVHLSSGEAAASHYCAEMVVDLVVHAWDLARAIGADERLDAELVGYAEEQGHARKDLVSSGFFAAPVQPPPDADLQTQMLGLYGRAV